MVDVIMADAQVTSAAECNLMYAGILSRGIVVADLFFYWSACPALSKSSCLPILYSMV